MTWFQRFILWLNGVPASKASPAHVAAASEPSKASPTVQASPASPASPDDIVGPAFTWLVNAWTTDERRAFLEVQRELGFDPRTGGLAVLFDEESGGDPTQPKEAKGTPRAGLNQITVGAHLPGFETAEKVWAVRSWPIVRQLREVVLPYWKRVNAKDSSPRNIMRLNFLPSDASKANDFKLGEAVKGADGKYIVDHSAAVEFLKQANRTMTWRENVYYSNRGIDAVLKGWFSWDDVDKRTAHAAKAAGRWVTVSGRVVTDAAPAVTASKPAAPAAPDATSALVSTPSSASSSPAPALLALRKQVDAQWPARSKKSDGIMGDASHQAKKSDHNSGDAIDFTKDAANGPDLDRLADVLFSDARTQYVIYNGRIRNQDIAGGAWRQYTGASPHTSHLHLSIRAARRNDASPWNIGAAPAATAPATSPAAPAATSAREEIDYKDGGKVARKAIVENGSTLIVPVNGANKSFPIDKATSLVGSAPAPVNATTANIAYALLAAYRKWGKAYGYKTAVTVDGATIVALYEEHPKDAGIDHPHPGVTMMKV